MRSLIYIAVRGIASSPSRARVRAPCASARAHIYNVQYQCTYTSGTDHVNCALAGKYKLTVKWSVLLLRVLSHCLDCMAEHPESTGRSRDEGKLMCLMLIL